jgi:NADH-quinone oxidoreductase subunit L/multicomponent Na+:H+ antiporter subunit D
MLNIAYFWPIVYQAFFETPEEHDTKPVIAGLYGGGEDRPAVTDGSGDPEDSDGDEHEDHDGHGDGHTEDEHDSHEDHEDHDGHGDGHTEDEHDSHEDHDDHDHHHGGPPAGGWERRGWRGGEASWFVLGPIVTAATGAVALGLAPALFVFLRLVQEIAASVGVVA